LKHATNHIQSRWQQFGNDSYLVYIYIK